MELTAEYLKDLCKSERMKNNDCYGTPELNDKLYLVEAVFLLLLFSKTLPAGSCCFHCRQFKQ